jgi:hypothetical protein
MWAVAPTKPVPPLGFVRHGWIPDVGAAAERGELGRVALGYED